MSTSPTTSSKKTARTKAAKGPARPSIAVDRVVPLDSIVPYWRNPRRIPEEAVEAVAESIRRYGYTQPIIVDADNTIVVGHTRYAALRRLGITQVPVRVAVDLSQDQIKQLRVLDNRVREFSSWSMDELTAELTELDHGLMRAYFPEIGVIQDDGPRPGPLGPDDPLSDPGEVPEWERVNTAAEFVCPHCFHTWTMEVQRSQVYAGRLSINPAPEGVTA